MAKDLGGDNALNAFNLHWDKDRGWHYHVTPGKFPYIIGGYWGTEDPRDAIRPRRGGMNNTANQGGNGNRPGGIDDNGGNNSGPNGGGPNGAGPNGNGPNGGGPPPPPPPFGRPPPGQLNGQ